MTASILQQLLALYFVIIYNWQLSSRFNFSSFFFIWQMPVFLISYAKDKLHYEQPTVLLARRHLSTTNFENLNSISNIFQETYGFLVLTDPVIISIYLRTTDIHLSDQRNVRHPTSKILKCDLVQTYFCCWEGISCLYTCPK